MRKASIEIYDDKAIRMWSKAILDLQNLIRDSEVKTLGDALRFISEVEKCKVLVEESFKVPTRTV